ncbi:MAG: hypothetical protein ACLFU2_06180 [Opitutales bacterium]
MASPDTHLHDAAVVPRALVAVGRGLAFGLGLTWLSIGLSAGPSSSFSGGRQSAAVFRSQAETSSRLSEEQALELRRSRDRGYLVNAPARDLVWAETTPSPTTTMVMRFERAEPRADAAELAKATESPETRFGPLDAPETSFFEDLPPLPIPLPQSPLEEEEGEDYVVPRRSSVLDEGFVDWVTQGVDESKLEVPFQLPSGADPVDFTPPSERVRLRYRDEP